MIIAVNPNKGLANSPDVVIISDDYAYTWESVTYWKSNGCYWHQNVKTGYTRFLFSDARLDQIGPHLWQTNSTSEGFGGAVFKLPLYGYGLVHLRGPWSGGCYMANQYLPRHTIEVTRINSTGHPCSCALPIDLVNAWLSGSGWQCWLQPAERWGQGVIRYEPIYKGNNKDLFSDAQMDEADEQYQETIRKKLHLNRRRV